MSAKQGNRAVMRGDEDARLRSIQDLLQVAQVRVGPVGPGRDKALRAPSRGKCGRVAGGVQPRSGQVPPAEGAHRDERLPRARIEDQRVDGRRELDLLVPLGTKGGGLKRWEYKRCGFIRGWRPTPGNRSRKGWINRLAASRLASGASPAGRRRPARVRARAACRGTGRCTASASCPKTMHSGTAPDCL